MSFDNVGERFEYVRHGGSWTTLQNNLAVVKELMKNNGHWGGIHAVYNIYNATRLVELTEFARSQKLTIHWQSLYQPECLDPARLGTSVLEQAQQEIQNLLSSGLCLDSERMFFENVLQNFKLHDNLCAQFCEHTSKIENQYLRNIAFWNSENQALESHDGKPFEVKGEMIGWSKLPKYYE
jgi:hypothetical protein